LTVPPANGTTGDQLAVATVNDFAPMVNIVPFGMCQTMANPQVAAATSAALGTLTPQPCMPVPTAPWTPGSSFVKLNEQKALTSDSKCTCAWTGTIEIASPGNAPGVQG
jgi:hypothetical protein